MNFINGLKEQALRRVLVMVLRRSIGMFLEDDIVLDQLQLEPESGLVRFTDIKLDCDVLNSYLDLSPLVVSSALVAELTATVSWGALHDGCTVTVRGISVLLAPRTKSSSKHHERVRSASPGADSGVRGGGAPSEGEDVSAGVVFLANWIDVLVAKLQLVVEDVSIHVQSVVNGPILQMNLNRLEVFNCGAVASKARSHSSSSSSLLSSVLLARQSAQRARGEESHDDGPESVAPVARLRVSAAIESSILIAQRLDVNTKILKFEGFSVSILTLAPLRPDSLPVSSPPPWHRHEKQQQQQQRQQQHSGFGWEPRGGDTCHYCTEIFSALQTGRVLIHSDAFGDASSSESSETSIDVRLPAVVVRADIASVAAAVAACTDPANRTPNTPSRSIGESVSLRIDSARAVSRGVLARHRLRVERLLRRLEEEEVASAGEAESLREVAGLLRKCDNTGSSSRSFAAAESAVGSEAFATALWRPTSSSYPADASISMSDLRSSQVHGELFAGADFIDSRSGSTASQDEEGSEDVNNVSSTAFFDAIDEEPESFPGDTAKQHSPLTIRLSLDEMSLYLSPVVGTTGDTSAPQLQLQMKGVGVQFDEVDKTIDISLTIVDAALYEIYSSAKVVESVQPILWFDQDHSLFAHAFNSCLRENQKQHVVLTSPPAIVTKFAIDSAGGVSVDVGLQDILSYFDAALLLRWKSTIAAFSNGTEASSQASPSVTVHISSVRLIAQVEMCPEATGSTSDDGIEAMALSLGLVRSNGDRSDATALRKWVCNNISFRDFMLQCVRDKYVGWHSDCALSKRSWDHAAYLSVEIVRAQVRVGAGGQDFDAGTLQPLVEIDRAALYFRLDMELLTRASRSHEIRYATFDSSATRKLTLRKFEERAFSDGASKESPQGYGAANLPNALLNRLRRVSEKAASSSADESEGGSATATNAGVRPVEKPQPPPLYGGAVFVFDAHSIKVDAHRLDISCIIESVSALIDTITVSSSEGANVMPPVSAQPNIISGFGMKVMSEVFVCSLESSFREFDHAATDETCRIRESAYCYTLSTREPLIEVYIGGVNPKDRASVLSKRVYVGLDVENVSFFQVPIKSRDDDAVIAVGLRVVGARASDADFHVPLLHGTGFTSMRSEHSEDEDRPCVLSIATLISTNASLNTRSTNLSIELRDVVLRYDPLSRWINNFVEVVSPVPLSDMLEQSINGRRQLHALRSVDKSAIVIERDVQRDGALEGSPGSSLFQTLSLSVVVRRALIDYCSVHSEREGGIERDGLDPIPASRFLLSIGNLTIGSSIVSKAPQFGLKISASDITIRLSNTIFNDPRFEMVPIDINGNIVSANCPNFFVYYHSFEEFLALHAFVRMGTVENLEVMLRTREGGDNFSAADHLATGASDEDVRMNVLVSVGGVVFFGCADSLKLLAASLELYSAQLNRVFLASEALFPEEASGPMDDTDRPGEEGKQNKDETWEEEYDDFGPHQSNQGTKLFKTTEEGLVIGNPRLKSPYLRPILPTSLTNDTQRRASILESLEPAMFAPRESVTSVSLARNESWAVSEPEQFAAWYDYDDAASVKSTRLNNETQIGHSTRFDRKIAFSSKTYDVAGPSVAVTRPLDGDDVIDEDQSFMRHVIDGDSSDEDDATGSVSGHTNVKSASVSTIGCNDANRKASNDGGWGFFQSNRLQEEFELGSVDDDAAGMPPVAGSQSILESLPRIDLNLGASTPKDEEDIEIYGESEGGAVEDSNASISSSYAEFRKNICDASMISEANITRSIQMHPKMPPRAVDPRGHNLTTHLEERSRLLGEDSFVVVDTVSEAEANEAPDHGRWLSGQRELKPSQINPYHVPVVTSNDIDVPEFERKAPRALIKLAISAVRFRLYSGYDWTGPDHPHGPHALAVQRRVRAIDDHNSSMHIRSAKSRHNAAFDPKQQSNKKPPVQTRDIIELIFHKIALQVRMYAISHEDALVTPVKLQSLRIHDVLVMHTRPGLRSRRVLGYWRSDKAPRESSAPMLQVTVATYSSPLPNEGIQGQQNKTDSAESVDSLHRMSISLLPLRCYLDAYFIDMVRNIVATMASDATEPSTAELKSSPNNNPPKKIGSTNVDSEHGDNTASTSPPSTIFFQHWYMAPISMKIDYEPRAFDIAKFKNGDYFELLNCFPPDGLEITMKVIRLSGVSGLMSGVQSTLRIWVDEVNANLLANVANVISSTAPLRGIASIGRGVHQHLLIVPAKEFSRSGLSGAARSVMGGFASVAQTVAKESLHAGHKVSKLVSHALGAVTTPLVVENSRRSSGSTDQIASRRALSSSGPRPLPRVPQQAERRAQSTEAEAASADPGLAESLTMAYGSIANSVATTVENIVLVPIREYQVSGSGGAISSVIRALPIAVLAPATGAAEAASHVLLGLRNELDPSRRREEQYAYVDIECSPDGSFRIK